jgi:hypothetical protein
MRGVSFLGGAFFLMALRGRAAAFFAGAFFAAGFFTVWRRVRAFFFPPLAMAGDAKEREVFRQGWTSVAALLEG